MSTNKDSLKKVLMAQQRPNTNGHVKLSQNNGNNECNGISNGTHNDSDLGSINTNSNNSDQNNQINNTSGNNIQWNTKLKIPKFIQNNSSSNINPNVIPKV